MRFYINFDTKKTANQFRVVKKNIKEAQHKTLRGAVKAALKRLLLPAALGGLPNYTGRARASFTAIAQEYGIRNAGPYTPNPTAPERMSRVAQNEGKQNPVTDNGGLNKMSEKVSYSMKLDIRNHGFPYFVYNEMTYQDDTPGQQLPRPWNLLLAMADAARKYIRQNAVKDMQATIRAGRNK